MKKMLVVLFSCFSLFANGQKGMNSIGMGVKIGIPSSANSYSYNYKDVGPVLQASFGVTKLGTVQAVVSSLFINLNSSTASQSNSLTLFQAGYRSHFLNSGAFVQADGGLVLWGRKNNTRPATSWIGDAGGGYSFKLSSTSFLDISSSANIVFNTGQYKLINSLWINGNIVYRFILKKKNK